MNEDLKQIALLHDEILSLRQRIENLKKINVEYLSNQPEFQFVVKTMKEYTEIHIQKDRERLKSELITQLGNPQLINKVFDYTAIMLH